jgi:hypothetical protein
MTHLFHIYFAYIEWHHCWRSFESTMYSWLSWKIWRRNQPLTCKYWYMFRWDIDDLYYTNRLNWILKRYIVDTTDHGRHVEIKVQLWCIGKCTFIEWGRSWFRDQTIKLLFATFRLNTQHYHTWISTIHVRADTCKYFHFKVEKDTMDEKKLVNEFFWISYTCFLKSMCGPGTGTKYSGCKSVDWIPTLWFLVIWYITAKQEQTICASISSYMCQYIY